MGVSQLLGGTWYGAYVLTSTFGFDGFVFNQAVEGLVLGLNRQRCLRSVFTILVFYNFVRSSGGLARRGTGKNPVGPDHQGR